METRIEGPLTDHQEVSMDKTNKAERLGAQKEEKLKEVIIVDMVAKAAMAMTEAKVEVALGRVDNTGVDIIEGTPVTTGTTETEVRHTNSECKAA